jgi:hypothetical protein
LTEARFAPIVYGTKKIGETLGIIRKRRLALIAAVLLTTLVAVSLFFLPLGRKPKEDIVRSIFDRMAKVRVLKKNQVFEYCARIRELAHGVNVIH